MNKALQIEKKCYPKFSKCYVCGYVMIERESSSGVYAVDIYGHKYCSKECVLEAEEIDAQELSVLYSAEETADKDKEEAEHE